MPQHSDLLIFSKCLRLKVNCILVIFQHWSLTYFISLVKLVKNQSSSYGILILIICINIKAFNRVKSKQLDILKIFLNYLKCCYIHKVMPICILEANPMKSYSEMIDYFKMIKTMIRTKEFYIFFNFGQSKTKLYHRLNISLWLKKQFF